MAGALAKLTFVPSHIEARQRGQRPPPHKIGDWWQDEQTQGFQAVLAMPEDVLPSLLPMLLAERLRFLVLNCSAPTQGQADIRSYRFADSVGADDLPPE
jgi:hypothetical protein